MAYSYFLMMYNCSSESSENESAAPPPLGSTQWVAVADQKIPSIIGTIHDQTLTVNAQK